MNSTMFIFAMSLVISVLLVNAEDGKYRSNKYNQNAGKYMPKNDRVYKHVDDMRELGRYHHVVIPYDGGYGPYFHIDNPYEHNAPEYEHVSSSSEYHPFNAEGYDIPIPEIPLVYGFPNIPSPSQSSPDTLLPPVTSPTEYNPTEYNPTDLPTTVTTDAAINQQIDSTTILSNGDTNTLNRKKRSLFHLQPRAIEIRPTPSARPRTRYDDEGKWRIIRQEENKQQKKYDYFFETENKIFAQEAGKISGKTDSKEGTSGVGWYQYVGDDGKVYHVDYEAGPQGFIPKGTHIHKAIQNHLDSLKTRNQI